MALLSSLNLAQASGLVWPANQLLPSFSAPAPTLDCIDVSSASSAEINLFSSLEGIVNRTQPQIVCVTTANGEGEFTWVNLHNLPYTVVNGYNAILQFRTNVTGLVVTDTNEADTLNLATTMAGVNNELICDPSLVATLTNAPYNLPIVDDLRKLAFSNRYQVYGYLYTNYWPQCTHRVIAGLETNVAGTLRDYLVAVKSATFWLDPGTSQDAALLGQFVSGMTPANGVYVGWWPSEGNGLTWIANYGIPVLASDYFWDASVFGGVASPINVPPIPPPPPLQNKVYVSLVFSDGDNIQYMQHAMKINWENSQRGAIPMGWTVSSLAANMDPGMLNYFWSTATSNDCLISGPSGAGYTHMELWNAANLNAYTSISDGYLQHAGLRVITVWDSVNSTIAQSYAANCPSLLGLADQGGAYNAVNNGLRTIAETPTYASTTNQMLSAISAAAAGWNGTAPVFILAQGVAWNLVPTDFVNIAHSYSTNEFVFVRPDHLYMLYNQVYGPPAAATKPALGITPTSARLQGIARANATNTLAWMEWGTNRNYGSQTAATNLGNPGNAYVTVNATISGLQPRQIYHYQIVASNALGESLGGDNLFTTGGRLEAWGNDAQGQTNLPAGLTNVVGLAAGAVHELALKNDGTVAAWGANSYGQTNVPAGLTNVIAVAAGIQHSLALLSNGTVVAWGGNVDGQTNVPAGLSNVVAIAAGGYHSLALSANSTVTAWGDNAYGQTNVPVGLSNVVGVAAGFGHSLALLANGTVAAWGYDGYGQTNVPAGLTNVLAVAAGEYHSVAVKPSGSFPANLNPSARWVADSLAGTNSSAVSNWTDVAAGISASQSAPASQPLLISNALNGHNTVRFSSASSQYLIVGAANSPISGAGDFTMVVVFRTSTPGNASGSFFLNTGLLGADQPGATTDWSLVINGTELGAGLGAGSSCTADVSLYGGNVTDGAAHIGAYVRSGGAIRLYVDGVIVAEQNSLCTTARGSDAFDIGAMTTAPYYFNGDIAEIQLYRRALTSWEMASLNGPLAATYGLSGVAGAPLCRWVADSLTGANGSSVGTWTDSLGGKTAVQNTAGNQPKVFTNVLNGHNTVRFSSSSSQFLTVSAAQSPISGAGSFTMVIVFKTSTPGNSSSSFYNNTGLLGADVAGIAADWSFVLNGSQLGAGLGAGTGGCGTDYSLYGGTVTDGNPHIGIYVRAGNQITLYVDGTAVATQSGLCADARTDCLFEIGAMTGPAYFFSGDIAEIQLYNRALSATEVASVDEVLAGTYGLASLGGQAGTIVTWGDSANGQATARAGLAGVETVASGSESLFNLALEASGAVTGWGDNSQGQLTPPPGLTNVAAVAAGSVFSLAIGNLPPSAVNLTASGYVNHDLAFALAGNSPDGNPLTYSVQSLPSPGALYQYSGGLRAAPISVPNTLVTDPNGQVIFAPATNGTGAPYTTFNFTVNDGYYNSGTAVATVDIGLPMAPLFTGATWNPPASGSNSLTVNFSGSSNATYSVWASTNLTNWVNLGTATEAPPGMYQFVDFTVTNWPQRFYSVTAP